MKVNPSLSTKQSVTFSEGNVRNNKTNVPQELTIVSSRSITRHKHKRFLEESIVHTEIHYTTKELNINEFVK